MSLSNTQPPKPFLKWAGGKKQLLESIRTVYPQDKEIKKYCEPFIGGGAVFFDIISRYQFEQVYISDTNAELVNTYRVIKERVDEMVTALKQMQIEYTSLEEEQRSVFYYQQRETFNALKAEKKEDTEVRRAALLLFLNRTCFNGLYRENAKGMFNVPQGRYKNPVFCDEENLRSVSRVLQNVVIHCGDFADAESFIDNETLVYFDPPYRPLSATSSFTAYQQGGFDDKEQIRLSEFVKAVDANGAGFILSNSDPKNTNAEDDFFDNLYRPFFIKRIPAKRMINSKAGGRGTVNELIVTNLPVGN